MERDELLTARAEAATRLEGVVEERTAELQQRGNILRVTFDNMDHGVVMFDNEFKLTSWNRQIVQLLELPESLLTGRQNFEDFVRFLAKRGEYGDVDAGAQLRKLTAEVGRHYTFERTRPDGTIIEITPQSAAGRRHCYHLHRHYRAQALRGCSQGRAQPAEAMSRSESSFLANMSHELRTPAQRHHRPHRHAGEQCGGALAPTRRWSRCAACTGRARICSGLINQVLDLSKIEAGKLRAQP